MRVGDLGWLDIGPVGTNWTRLYGMTVRVCIIDGNTTISGAETVGSSPKPGGVDGWYLGRPDRSVLSSDEVPSWIVWLSRL